jgi:hypothetical protein
MYIKLQVCDSLYSLFRRVDDSNLLTVAKYCRDLEQFDILGTNLVSPSAAKAYVVIVVLCSCNHGG